MRPTLFLLLLAVAVAPPVSAQLAPPPVQVGQRVRLTLTNERKDVEGWVDAQVLRGNVTELAAGSLLLALHPDVTPARVQFSAITDLELSAGVEAWWEAAWRQGSDTALNVALQLFLYKWAADGFRKAWSAGFWGGAVGFVGGGIWGGFRPRVVWVPSDWPTPRPPGFWELIRGGGATTPPPSPARPAGQ
jgi:hypothetical protein